MRKSLEWIKQHVFNWEKLGESRERKCTGPADLLRAGGSSEEAQNQKQLAHWGRCGKI